MKDVSILEKALADVISEMENEKYPSRKQIVYFINQRLAAYHTSDKGEDVQNKYELEFQPRVEEWLVKCFGEKIAKDATERNHRFLEESLELVQSLGCSKSEAIQLVEYVFERPIGEPDQEIGGVIVTLSALCSAHGISMMSCGYKELSRIWIKIDKVREKQANKPKHSPLPQAEAIKNQPIEDDLLATIKERDYIANAYDVLNNERDELKFKLAEREHRLEGVDKRNYELVEYSERLVEEKDLLRLDVLSATNTISNMQTEYTDIRRLFAEAIKDRTIVEDERDRYKQALMKIAYGGLEKTFYELTVPVTDQQIALKAINPETTNTKA